MPLFGVAPPLVTLVNTDTVASVASALGRNPQSCVGRSLPIAPGATVRAFPPPVTYAEVPYSIRQ
ncbi:MAG: hypothetical protein KA110_03620 [Acidimicrobiia bacterium]|nr:hypothetical protein [Acidimicrobiia bacterium]